MIYRYCEWDGTEFPTQDHLSLFANLMEFVLAYGDEALRELEELELDEQHRKMLEELIRQGLLERTAGRWRLTPRAVRVMQRQALMEIFRGLRGAGREGHEVHNPGSSTERSDGTRPYRFGDPVSQIEISATLRNALARQGPGLPIRIRHDDVELFNMEGQASVSLALLLDMSGSMARYGRYLQAKKCAMALHALLRQQFPQDTVDVIEFATTARLVPEYKLPLLLPRPVTIFDPQVRMQIPLNQADTGPPHFTNLHMALMLARRVLIRRPGDNKLIFIITDGEPTAHLQGNYICLLYPPDRASIMATLTEALHTARQGIRVATFALIDDYWGMDWVGFVDQLTRTTRGVAFYCDSGDLTRSEYRAVSYTHLTLPTN